MTLLEIAIAHKFRLVLTPPCDSTYQLVKKRDAKPEVVSYFEPTSELIRVIFSKTEMVEITVWGMANLGISLPWSLNLFQGLKRLGAVMVQEGDMEGTMVIPNNPLVIAAMAAQLKQKLQGFPRGYTHCQQVAAPMVRVMLK